MKTKLRNVIYIVGILLVFSLLACKNGNEDTLIKYFEPFNETMEIIKDQDKIVEQGFSSNVKTLINLGKEPIIIEYNKKENIELKNKYETFGERYLVKEKYESAYKIFRGDYQLKNSLLTNKEQDTLYRYLGEEKEFVLPETIKYINDYAFMRNASLEKLTIHDFIQYQQGDSIYECEKLSDLTIPYLYEDPNIMTLKSGISGVGELSIFMKDNSLKRITLTKQTLFNYPFFTFCRNLEYVKITSEAKELGEILKYSTVEDVILPDTLEEINDTAFWLCERLKELIVPSNVKLIGSRVFEVTLKLEKIFIPKSVEIIKSQAIQNLKDIKIFCEDEEKKSTWANDFYKEPATILYGSTLEDYLNDNNPLLF